eukprot:TRINITY_DN3397_c0_g3_i6.p2 TRINITY_DN3397_c0_g3~~TRINITY_DN3397_c0_g3_i6.p2  ORF type:complete len:138 (+),score=30.48 TRINITY_DN3397_c0_g3_i6:113-526(+)
MQDNDHIPLHHDTDNSSPINSEFQVPSDAPTIPVPAPELKGRTKACSRIAKNKNKLKVAGKKAEISHDKNKLTKSKREAKQKKKLETFTRRLWMTEEDTAIGKLVEKYGIKKWTLISKKLQEEYRINGRTGKQCRER